jgi:hypothetical protein
MYSLRMSIPQFHIVLARMGILDLLFASKDLERIGIAHDVHAAHVSSSLATNGTLT